MKLAGTLINVKGKEAMVLMENTVNNMPRELNELTRLGMERRMRCSECPQRTAPLNYCAKYKWAIQDKSTLVIGCNVDGELPEIDRE